MFNLVYIISKCYIIDAFTEYGQGTNRIVNRHRFLQFNHETYTAKRQVAYDARYLKLVRKDIHSSSTLDMDVMVGVAEGTAINELNEFLEMSLVRPSGSVPFTSLVWWSLL